MDSGYNAENSHLRSILDNLGAYVFTKDALGRYTYANNMVCELFGHPLSDVVGKTDESFFDLKISDQLRQFDRRVLDKGERVEAEETNIIASTGESRIYWSVKLPLRDPDGKIGGVLGISTDITERKRMEKALETAKREAEEATRIKDKFLALVSHDLRGPLGSVSGLLEYAAQNEIECAEKNKVISKTKYTVDGLLEMIGNLLDISRIRSGRFTPEKKELDFRQLAEEALGKLRHLADQKKINLVIDVQDNFTLYADPHLTGEIIFNLAGNAIKFTKPGGLVAVEAGSGPSFKVRDTGVGIPESIRANLFDDHVKTTTFGTSGERGTGFGLPLCKDMIMAQGGDIRFETGADGTTFVVEFQQRGSLVLVVDDQPAYRQSIAGILRTIANVEIIEAENGLDAIGKIVDKKPLLVITDVNMPEMDGFAFLAAIRKEYGKDELPVVVSTSFGSSSPDSHGKEINFKTRAFELGANDFVNKPVIREDFIPRVKRFLP